ncbi:collagenase 3-like [Dendronephthya gigantea]|uniref:collagenase 3-like n=1 Tax=Dendronephthya gigantea TaxID=151771 RepID=UPI001069D842|nr:collagenase 3-like [Dendronephthya gigantea]
MTRIQMYLAIFLTMLPLVTASPIHSLTRDNVAKHNKNHLKVVQYLGRYGHLDDKPDARSLIHSQRNKQFMADETKPKLDVFHPYTDDEITNGIKSFQISFGLKISGELNEETMKVMESPRCGFSDKGANNAFRMTIHVHRRKRYSIKHKLPNGQMKEFKWNKKKITWNILIYYKHLTNKIQDETLEKAFKLWEYSTPLLFTKTSSKVPDIRIEFAPAVHGDKFNFDGPGGVLAHAYPPVNHNIAGDIHFDASEKWDKDYDLFSVALHEIGHSIGLAHSSIPPSIMYGTYKKKPGLHWDDRDGINALYGPCKTKLDAAIYLWGDVYFLRKDLIWKIDEFDMQNSYDTGYPKKIKDEFISTMPNDVDAALVWSDHFLYVLKGSRSYGYDRFAKNLKYDSAISYDWPKIPNSPNASLCYTDDKITWFFKGDSCWKMNDWNLNVFQGYPKKITDVWQGVPDNIDAAYYSSWSKETYFFKGTEYWVVDNRKYKQEPYKAYPGGQIHKKWKGVCSEKY